MSKRLRDRGEIALLEEIRSFRWHNTNDDDENRNLIAMVRNYQPSQTTASTKEAW